MRDVAIVGAGPAGLHAACRLAEAGLDVEVFEAQAKIGEGVICSGVIGEEAFARFDLPASPVLTSICRIQAVSPAGRKLEHGSEVPLARVVDKKAFNQALSERALAAGAEFALNRRVESIEPEKHSLTLRFRSVSGDQSTSRARVAIIASGVNGSLSRSLGLARPRQFLKAMQSEIALPGGNRSAPTKVYVGPSVAPGAFGWEIPLTEGRVRVGIMTTADPVPYFRGLLRRIAPMLEVRQVSGAQKCIAQASVGRCVMDHLLAVGEAAGHVKTSTGGGIYYGLLSAEFAVAVLLRAFREGDFTARALADFDRYWRTAFGSELLVGYFARKLASCLSDSSVERVFEAVNSRGILTQLNGRLRFDWHWEALVATLRSLMICPDNLRCV